MKQGAARLTRHVDDIVDSALDPVVAILIHANTVTGKVVSRIWQTCQPHLPQQEDMLTRLKVSVHES